MSASSLTRALETMAGREAPVLAPVVAPVPVPLPDPAAATELSPEAPDGEAGEGRRTTVLVVDDDPYILEAVGIRLEAEGMVVIEATGGNEGFALAYTEMPEVIIADYNMPKGTGEYTLTRLRQTAETKEIPVVVITGLTSAKEPNHALEREILGRRGAVGYLSKPLDFEALLDLVRRHTPR